MPMRAEAIQACVDASAAALELTISAAHRPGVLHYFGIAAEQAALVMAVPLEALDEPAYAFTPIAPGDLGPAGDA